MRDRPERQMQDLRPTVWIGKQGCTETMIREIVSQLKRRRIIKVKWLQNTDVDPEDIAARARAVLVEVRGRTMVLAGMNTSPAGMSAVQAAGGPGRTERKRTR